MHGLDVVHRDLKAENLVFAAKGSPMIKFIDFGGSSTWTADEGLTGLVGTPQYVAPEVVTGYGEVNPTGEPYGKGCDLWSMGVLLYVMLSKTMPFRAKEVDQLLKQVVKGKFSYKPDDRWRHISSDAKDLISGLLQKDPTKRLTIGGVKEHPWCAAAIKRWEENMPKPEVEKAAPSKKGRFKPMLKRVASNVRNNPVFGKGNIKIEGKPKNQGVSREQQYWCVGLRRLAASSVRPSWTGLRNR
jgi:serine/threonine protein kinase